MALPNTEIAIVAGNSRNIGLRDATFDDLGVYSRELADLGIPATGRVFVRDCLINLGTCVAMVNQGKPGTPAFDYTLAVNGQTRGGSLAVGDIKLEPLGVGETAQLAANPARGVDLGQGRGKALRGGAPPVEEAVEKGHQDDVGPRDEGLSPRRGEKEAENLEEEEDGDDEPRPGCRQEEAPLDGGDALPEEKRHEQGGDSETDRR